MYEREVKRGRRRDAPVMPEAGDGQGEVRALAILPWEEHCTECAIPACYASCPLYEARSDGRCRRFVQGFVPVDGPNPSLQGEMVSVSFKRWAELMAYGNAKLVRIDRVRQLERALAPVEALGRWSPDSRVSIRGRRGPTTRLVRRLKQRLAKRSPLPAVDDEPPDYFLAEIHNPNAFQVNLSLTVRNSGDGSMLPFQALLEVTPGFRRYRIDAADIAERVDLSSDFVIKLSPNITDPDDEGLELMFGAMSFVRDAAYRRGATSNQPLRSTATRHVKVLAWDLDNTVWNGTLIEDGPGKVALKPGVAEVMRELTRRGIVNTLVSKNNEEDALQEVARLGLDEHIVFPKVSWNPKSVSLKELVRQFNVGEDTFAFIDDSAFERAEVKTNLPSVRVYDGADYERLLELPEFRPPESSESSRRREFYLSQEARQKAVADFDGSYEEFLRQANVRLSVSRARLEQLDRIAELAQRTNQLNFSGTRYATETLAAMLEDDALDCFVMSCQDNFGDYGTVGFAVVEKAGPQLIDLMFSCRIQAKRVEHAFLEFLLAWEAEQGHDELLVRYVRTERNSPAGKVFDDLGFALVSTVGATETRRLTVDEAQLGHQPPVVLWEGRPWTFSTAAGHTS
jgi:FkbH-like protein